MTLKELLAALGARKDVSLTSKVRIDIVMPNGIDTVELRGVTVSHPGGLRPGEKLYGAIAEAHRAVASAQAAGRSMLPPCDPAGH